MEWRGRTEEDTKVLGSELGRSGVRGGEARGVWSGEGEGHESQGSIVLCLSDVVVGKKKEGEWGCGEREGRIYFFMFDRL